jgi:type IV pilus biogenesis protein CpaD/CtpE
MKFIDLKALRLGVSLCTVIAITACASTERQPFMDEPSEAAQHKFVIKRDYIVGKFNINELNSLSIMDAKNRYETNGIGPLYIAMAKDSSTKKDELAKNKKIVNDIADKLNRAGIHDTTISIAQVENAHKDLVVLAFATEELKLSEDCKTPNIPGYYGNTRSTMGGYKLGCQKSLLMMRQVSDVNDLKGKGGLGSISDGDRSANIVTNYHTSGETQEFLPSYVVSELAAN